MLVHLYAVVAAGLALGNFVQGKFERKLPSYIKVCRKSDPDIGSCIKNAVYELRPYLLKGIPELGIPSYDPLVVPQIELKQQGTRAVNFKAKFRNVTATGGSKFDIIYVKADLDKFLLEFHLTIPQLTITSEYDVDAHVLLLPVNGRGTTHSEYYNITSHTVMEGDTFEKEGRTFINVTRTTINFDIGNGTIYFDNLFNGNKELGNAVNKYFNEHFHELQPEVKPVVEEAMEQLFQGMSNKVTQAFPFDMLLPDD